MTVCCHPQTPKERVVVALDIAAQDQLSILLKTLREKVSIFKIGKQLFTAFGPDVVRRIRGEGFDVFLDLKFHDIPNTVASAVKAASELSVSMLTIHAQGGKNMMQAAVQAAKASQTKPLILAVSLLTSLAQPDLQQLGILGTPSEAVERLAGLALQAGVDGLVSSSLELSLLRSRFGKDPVLVTPGIRPTGSSKGDQARVGTPAQAVAAGADFLVVGRPITQAFDPAEAFLQIVDELETMV